MAQIMKFPAGGRGRSSERTPPAEGAQILFFTGVRYVREPLSAAKPPRRPRRRRSDKNARTG